MTKRTKTKTETTTDQEPPTPPLEDRVRADYADFLDHLADKYRDELGANMYWPIETAPLSAVPALKAMGQRMQKKVKVAPRPPWPAPPPTHPPAGSQQLADPQTGSVRR